MYFTTLSSLSNIAKGRSDYMIVSVCCQYSGMCKKPDIKVTV